MKPSTRSLVSFLLLPILMILTFLTIAVLAGCRNPWQMSYDPSVATFGLLAERFEKEVELSPKATVEPEADADTESEAETEAETETECESETQPETDSDTEQEAENDTEPEAELEMEFVTEFETEAKPETESGTDPHPETQPETEPETQLETQLETEPETKPETEPETEPESVYDPERYVVISTAEDLMAFNRAVAKGETDFSGRIVIFLDDVDMRDYTWTPLDGSKLVDVIFDGREHTISHLRLPDYTYSRDNVGCGFVDAAVGLSRQRQKEYYYVRHWC